MSYAVQTEGSIWEDRAAEFLAVQGLDIVDRNFRCKVGELDIVAVQEDQIVFVEVRKRQRSRFSSASSSVNKVKQTRLQRSAAYYLRCKPQWRQHRCRFDVIAWDVTGTVPAAPLWLQNVLLGF